MATRIGVSVCDGGPRSTTRPTIALDGPTGEVLYLDENHAAALVLALQAAIAEVQARAVSL